jgi:hypothetical protein
VIFHNRWFRDVRASSVSIVLTPECEDENSSFLTFIHTSHVIFYSLTHSHFTSRVSITVKDSLSRT